MRYTFKHHHFIYIAAFVLLVATATTTIYGADSEQYTNSVDLVGSQETLVESQQSFIQAVDVDPMDPARPQDARVGSTIKVTWNLEGERESARLLVSENNGKDWELLKVASESGLYLYVVENTAMDSLLFSVATSDNTLVSQPVFIKK